MTKRTRRNHSPDFKAEVALAALKGDKTIAQLSDQYGVHVRQITARKDQLQASAASAFGPVGAAAAAPAVDIKSLHAKIWELTLENGSLEGRAHQGGIAERKATTAFEP